MLKKKFLNSMMIAAALTMPISAAPTAVFADENTNTTQTNQNHQVSVQKLYANVYDQESGKLLGRYLLDVETGYTDSPHRMFNAKYVPKINGYAVVGNPSTLIPVDWNNPSGITEMNINMVKTTSDIYKKMYGNSGQSSTSNPQVVHPKHHAGTNVNSGKSKTQGNQNSSSTAQSSTNQSSSAKDKKSKSKKATKSSKTSVKKHATNSKKNNVPTIVICSVILILAIAAIVWGVLKMRKPRKSYKHMRK